ncbi:MAG TPA: hypothetical protein VGM73_17080 [Candidatus Didemnitutus sp.]|jgi:hypothetical protein
MKLAILSESPADEAALRVLAGYVLGVPIDRIATNLRARGWPSVEQILPFVLRHLHFNTGTELLVVVVDSDDTPIHTPDHDAPGYFQPQCRICRLRAVYRRTTRNLPPVHGRRRVLRAIGLAVPAIEAWYLCGRDTSVTEEAWVTGLASGRLPYTRRELKWRVYGTDRPSLPFEIRRAVEEVSRHRGDVRRLENDFPSGFGSLARDLRAAPGAG